MTDTSNTASGQSARPRTAVWLSLRYHDALAGIEFLTSAFGFEKVVVYVADDGSTVEHAELAWPLGGGLMLGSYRDSPEWPQVAGHAAAYLLTDDPDALFGRAVAAGATVVRPLTDQDYGNREFVVADPEGNLWSFGTYAGEADPA